MKANCFNGNTINFVLTNIFDLSFKRFAEGSRSKMRNFVLFCRILICEKKIDYCPKFRYLRKFRFPMNFLIFHHNCDFFTKISIFDENRFVQNFEFWPKFRFFSHCTRASTMTNYFILCLPLGQIFSAHLLVFHIG